MLWFKKSDPSPDIEKAEANSSSASEADRTAVSATDTQNPTDTKPPVEANSIPQPTSSPAPQYTETLHPPQIDTSVAQPNISSQPNPSEPGLLSPQSANATNSPSSAEFPSEPPALHYSLNDNNRKFTITWFWTLIVVDIIAIPIVLYFTLFYLTSLSHEAVFSISTGCLGGVSIAEYFIRFWRLFKKGSTCRPIGGRRWYMDWFHWNFSIAWFPIMIELIVGTSMDEPPIRLLAMPVSTLCWWFGFEMLLSDILRIMRIKQFVRISSVPRGEPFRPCIYALIEDIIAVDGSGGTEFRINLDKRYKASHYFRLMLHRLALFWGFGACLAATVTTILVFTLGHDAAYVIGWCLPFVWAGISALFTTWYVKKSLRYEREQWKIEANLKARRNLTQSRFSVDQPRRTFQSTSTNIQSRHSTDVPRRSTGHAMRDLAQSKYSLDVPRGRKSMGI